MTQGQIHPSPRRAARRRRGLLPWILAAALLLAAAPAAADGGFGTRNEGAFMGLGLASSGTVPTKVALFATDKGRRIDVPGYLRVDVQPQRMFTARPALDEGSAFSNFGMHGGYMGLDLGPLCFGGGFGFDFYTVGVRDLGAKKISGSEPTVTLNLELAVGLRVGSYIRLLTTMQFGTAMGLIEQSAARTGFTADLMFALGRSGIALFVSLESGSFSSDAFDSFGAGQATFGIAVGSNG
jgi:hypothetical protein